MEHNLVKGLYPEFKRDYLRLIALGQVETNALKTLSIDWYDFFELCARDPQFRTDIDEARKSRADKWVDRIAISIDKKYYSMVEGVEVERPPVKDELGKDKLDFEKLKFLAQADNPDKYSGGMKPKIDINFDMTDFKLLPPEEALRALKNDPFAIEAEIIVKETKDEQEESKDSN